MTNYGIHTDDARKIAEDAVRRAKQRGYARGWTSVKRLRPLWANGTVGIRDPKKFLVYQDKGTKPFLMTALEGKTIPIKDKNSGQVRFVKVRGVGSPGWGGPPGARVWKNQKWRHPGIRPTNFMKDSLNEAIEANKHIVSDRLKRIVNAADTNHDYFLQ